MTSLRQAEYPENGRVGFGRGLGLAFFCLLVSIWLHLIFFSVWQHFDRRAADRFYFQMENDSAPIELTLMMGPPPAPGPEAGADEPSGAEASEAPLVLNVEDGPAVPAPTEAAEAQSPDLQPLRLIDESLAGAELLSEPEPEDAPPGAEAAAAVSDAPLSMESEAPKFKSYYTVIRSAVARLWIMPPEAKNHFRPGRLTVDFTINSSGALMRIVVIESSGSATLDHAGLEALRSAAPFPPFPDDLKAYSQLDIRMHFDYQEQYINRRRKNGRL
ncbi:MAG: energy transducer TonB [Candidatus Adiutrix sp.]|jgi:TonB family protein|nr:energy transducer TonB [Candidatus Adiutrix sp.]